MNPNLKKKIVLVVLLVAMVTGIATAAFVTTLKTVEVNLREPITTEITDDLPEQMDPGTIDFVVLYITNDASVGYTLKVVPEVVIIDADPDNDGVLLTEDE